MVAYKWFQSLRSGFPLERGITRLDFSKLRCASRAPLKRDYISNLIKIKVCIKRRPIEKVVVLSIHGYVSIYRSLCCTLIYKIRCESRLAGQRSHWALDEVLKPLLEVVHRL
jgi:hypothetical protein